MTDLLQIVFLMIAGPILVISILRQPYVGIALTVASMPVIDLLPSIPYLSSSVILIGLLTLVGFLLHSKRLGGKRSTRSTTIYAVGAVFILWFFLSNPEAALFESDRNWILTFVQLWVLLVMAGETLDSPSKLHRVMVIFSTAAIISAFYTILSGQLTDDPLTSARVSGFTDNANAAARYFVVSLVFLTYLRALTPNPFLKLLALVGIILTFSGVFFTVSRTGILLLFMAEGLILLLQSEIRQKAQSVLIFVTAFAVLLLMSDKILSIIQSIFPAIAQGSDTLGLRYNLWRAGWQMWLEHPIAGVGIGMYPARVGPIMVAFSGPRVWSAVAHNMYVQVLSETGLVGFFLFGLMLITALKNFRLDEGVNKPGGLSLQDSWLIAFIVMLVGGITKSDQANKLVWMMMGASVYFSQGAKILVNDASNQPSNHPSGFSRFKVQPRRSVAGEFESLGWNETSRSDRGG